MLFWAHPDCNLQKQQLCHHVFPISQIIQSGRTRHIEHWLRNLDKLISDVLLWTFTHGRTSVCRPVRIYIDHLCVDTGSSLEDILGVMNDKDRWRKKESGNSGLSAWLCDDDDVDKYRVFPNHLLFAHSVNRLLESSLGGLRNISSAFLINILS